MRSIPILVLFGSLLLAPACSAPDETDAPETGGTGSGATGGTGAGTGASSSGGGGGPTCVDACALGSSDCFGSATRTCALQSTGCADFNLPVACAAEQICRSGQCVVGCSDPCVVGQLQCAGVRIQSCVAEATGCTLWAEATDCPTGQTCNGGACVTTCADLCMEGSTECVGARLRRCMRQQNGCTDWSPAEDCPVTQACVDGACASSCTDACVAGTTACSGDLLQSCTVQATGCTALDAPVSCPPGQTCQDSACRATGAGGTGGGNSGGSSGSGGDTTGGSSGSGGDGTGGDATGGSSGTGGDGTGGDATGGSSGTGGSATGGSAGACDPGSTATDWATSCPTTATTCAAGTWTAWGSSSPENYPFRYETEHFAFYWPDGRSVTVQQAQTAGQFLEDVVWATYFGDPIYFPEIDCTLSSKRKTSIHIIESGLYGGCNNGRPGMWVGPGAMTDHWGLAHEFMHAVQCMNPGFADCGGGGCWIHESHANWMPHQLAEYRGDVHCSEMLVNMPHLYYGSTRDRYCNWQFFEFLKDRHCYAAVNEMWTESAPSGQRDPWNKLALNLGWDAERLNDEFGAWAMHNVTWDYQNPPPTAGGNQSATYRARYGALTDESRPERRLRITALEPLDEQWTTSRRFASPHYSAPQRFGYNVVRLHPDAGATSVTVTFRGVVQSGADSGWRWGLVATDSGLTTARYSALQAGADGQLTFCVGSGESLWLVVTATPTSIQKIVWDQAYPSIYRYPYLVELEGAWPDGFRDGQLDACPAGTVRHSNGGGCAPSGLATSVYVGPYARVLGGTVSGTARIEGHAVILSGATVSGGTVGARSLLSRFSVSGSAVVQTTFYPPGFFEAGQGLAGTARLFGDVEYRGQGLSKSSGSYYGFVDESTASATIEDVTVAPPYGWRP